MIDSRIFKADAHSRNFAEKKRIIAQPRPSFASTSGDPSIVQALTYALIFLRSAVS